jgi:hypothetical protein
MRWDLPVLSFTIGSHGALGMGSTRPELQNWLADPERKTAERERQRKVPPDAGASGSNQDGTHQKRACR